MTITTRSKRVSAFGANTRSTPASVGPGSYAPEATITSFKDVSKNRPLFSGFAASEERNLNANKTTSAITPGPGAYIDGKDQPGSAKAPSNVFATKASRFAPTAPGSTIFLPSSVQDNPGPGAYMLRSSTSPPQLPGNNNQLHELDGRNNKFVTLKPSAPAIPKKEQSYGYLQVGSELRAQMPPPGAAMYSGIGQDTVGPAAPYNTHRAAWNDKKNVAPSLKSTVKREVWEANAPHISVPGPGHYGDDAGAATGEPFGKKKGRGKQERQSAVFASKVPILPTSKPTTHFDPEKDLEIHAKESRLRYQLERQRTNVLKAKMEAFGSTTGRVELSSQINAPYSHPSFIMTPGPGMYVDSNNASHHRGRHRKKHAVRGDASLGFSSTTERYCLSKPSSANVAAPGPGTYKSETPRSLDQSVKAKLSVGRHSVFGTTSERHVWEHLEKRVDIADVLTPGPGAYDSHTSAAHAGHVPHATTSAAFKSNSSRFMRHANHPHVHCVGGDVGPGVGQYDVVDPLTMGKPLAASLSSPPTSARAPFLSTCERQVFDTRGAQDLPGPGTYATTTDDDAMHLGSATKPVISFTRMNEIRASIGHEARFFRVKPTVPETVGPGAYTIPGTVGSKSFNVTMAAALPTHRRR
uniref:Sperm-tail PG-rich repeat-containing protein 2 n=1 Tax=Globisporangium ultimum (strain ATCC 200006 / CBS 805.95 / DAOM BR144) TaxID=431595 RepID=K3X693_GLOUD